MGFKRSNSHCFSFLLLVFLMVPTLALNTDGVLLLSFKHAILSDPLSVLQSWNRDDKTPCAWTGVTCTEIGLPGTPDRLRVTSLVLPNSHLLGSISEDLGHIQHLRHLDLSSNNFNGILPSSIFNSTELQVLSLSGNLISGSLPETIGALASLQLLNLSHNALAGKVPENLTALQNLSVVSLKGNYLSGNIPSGFDSVEVLDLSSNLLNGSLPLDLGGVHLNYLNLSYNKISGSISPEFAKKLPQNATIDLSFNNLSGAIPESVALLNQKMEFFSGNIDLCGKPLKTLCAVPSTLSTPPNMSQSISPAIAVIPNTVVSTPVTSSSPNNIQNQARGSLKPGTIAAIAVADLAGISILGMIILYVYQLKKRKDHLDDPSTAATSCNVLKQPKVIVSKTNVELRTKMPPSPPSSSSSSPSCSCSCSCMKLKLIEASETNSSDSDLEEKNQVINVNQRPGKLVTVDGETELELETLLKASAYILGTSGWSIVYKAVLENGTAFAVRRIGESSVERLKDFESRVRMIAKLRHPNLVKIRGFYWGDTEKLVIYDYVSNGSLACTTTAYRRSGSSSVWHLPLEARLKIARGVARGLAYIHEKKQVHGNIKPTNILLDSNMEPIISDLGLDRLLSRNGATYKPNNSSSIRFLSSQRSTASRDAPSDHPTTPTNPSPHAAATCSTPYQALESLKNHKPNPKWDVYSFGMILLELLSGRVLSTGELEQWAVAAASIEEEKNRAVRLGDMAIKGDMEGKEEAILTFFRLGFSCVSVVPQKRPSMKEAVQILEKITWW
ncbi:hypothetical protein ERO13_A12G022300v2 [Gossypium hirsutum]|uniref:Receptor protein kinase-like protein At4g34220 n=1 Tax=Gossypium hirsutum TaxID=3635 RepID=A0ABM2Z6W2_GOSHI|nr:receptor protein kinase-like protein At4g34220 [Gossypium hirsutum]XP_040938425.1 receptor protein kinase-like protein At4g34220 [Gossypium hirsutum]KAG4168413.1 hypothetical protein ERO13_A12G022300v2 [Gossypium hirsutum]KAG4168414.1 hypothetical protein ERO13_A12G022300v2 [Gossypium hirsutum]